MVDRKQAPRRVDEPEEGFFLYKLVRGGPLVPARIERTEEGFWRATIDGTVYPASPDPVTAPKVISVWTYGERSTMQEYAYRLEVKRFHVNAGDDHPSAHADKRIDLENMKPIF